MTNETMRYLQWTNGEPYYRAHGKKTPVLVDQGVERFGFQFTVSAQINPGIDWSAYYLTHRRDNPYGRQPESGPFQPVGFEEMVVHTADRGDKLPEAVARFFFPGIEELYRG